MSSSYPLLRRFIHHHHVLAGKLFGVSLPEPTLELVDEAYLANSTEHQKTSEPHILLSPQQANAIERRLKRSPYVSGKIASPVLDAVARQHAFHDAFVHSSDAKQQAYDDARYLLSEIADGTVRVVASPGHPLVRRIGEMLGRGNQLLATQLAAPIIVARDKNPDSRAYDQLRAIVVPSGNSQENIVVQAHELAHYLRAFDPKSNIDISPGCGRMKEEHRADVLALLMVPASKFPAVSQESFLQKISKDRASYYLQPDQLFDIAQMVKRSEFPSLHYDDACHLDAISAVPTAQEMRATLHKTR